MHPSCHFIRAVAFGLIGWALLASPARAQEDSLDDLTVDSATGSDEEVFVLEFKFQALRMIKPRAGLAKGRIYWYMLYTVENKSDKDRDFFLSVNAYSDREKKYKDMLLPSVERAIENKLGKTLWGQTDKFKILRGRDPKDMKYNYTTIKAKEKRQCVAVFNKLDPDANNIRIEVIGLSNDIEAADQDDGSTLIKERVRVLQFERRGDEYGIGQDSFRKIDRGWIKKTTKIQTGDSGASAGES